MVEEITVESGRYKLSVEAESDMLVFGDLETMSRELENKMRRDQRCLILSSVKRWEDNGAEKVKEVLAYSLGERVNQFELSVKENPLKHCKYELWVYRR